MKGSLKLGNITGIGIYIHWTFTLLLVFIIFVNLRSGQTPMQIVWSVLFILCIFSTVFLHELGHALAAKKYGIKTRDITLLPIGGLARLERIPEKPKEELVVALAGPLVNISLAILTGIFITVPENAEVLINELKQGINSNTFFINFFIVNLWLALFNLIPAFPMDGGRVLRALLTFKLQRHVATKIAARIGQLIAIGFIVLGFFVNPFLIFIGIFIIIGAQIENEYTQSKYFLKGYSVRDIIMKDYQTIESEENLKKAVFLLLNSQNKYFLITQNGEPIGTLNRDQIIEGLSVKGDQEPVTTFMNSNLIYLHVDALLENVFELIYEHKSELILVTENDKIIGTLDTENLLEFILIQEVKSRKTYVE